jgi:hypothetical protein
LKHSILRCWRRSATPIKWKMGKHYIKSRRAISHIQ